MNSTRNILLCLAVYVTRTLAVVSNLFEETADRKWFFGRAGNVCRRGTASLDASECSEAYEELKTDEHFNVLQSDAGFFATVPYGCMLFFPGSTAGMNSIVRFNHYDSTRTKHLWEGDKYVPICKRVEDEESESAEPTPQPTPTPESSSEESEDDTQCVSYSRCMRRTLPLSCLSRGSGVMRIANCSPENVHGFLSCLEEETNSNEQAQCAKRLRGETLLPDFARCAARVESSGSTRCDTAEYLNGPVGVDFVVERAWCILTEGLEIDAHQCVDALYEDDLVEQLWVLSGRDPQDGYGKEVGSAQCYSASYYCAVTRGLVSVEQTRGSVRDWDPAMAMFCSSGPKRYCDWHSKPTTVVALLEGSDEAKRCVRNMQTEAGIAAACQNGGRWWSGRAVTPEFPDTNVVEPPSNASKSVAPAKPLTCEDLLGICTELEELFLEECKSADSSDEDCLSNENMMCLLDTFQEPACQNSDDLESDAHAVIELEDFDLDSFVACGNFAVKNEVCEDTMVAPLAENLLHFYDCVEGAAQALKDVDKDGAKECLDALGEFDTTMAEKDSNCSKFMLKCKNVGYQFHEKCKDDDVDEQRACLIRENIAHYIACTDYAISELDCTGKVDLVMKQELEVIQGECGEFAIKNNFCNDQIESMWEDAMEGAFQCIEGAAQALREIDDEAEACLKKLGMLETYGFDWCLENIGDYEDCEDYYVGEWEDYTPAAVKEPETPTTETKPAERNVDVKAGTPGGDECPRGYQPIKTAERCFEVAPVLPYVGAKSGRTWTGSHYSVPKGCSFFSKGDRAVLFNKYPNPKNNGKYTPICIAE